jgi:hypothetical protein
MEIKKLSDIDNKRLGDGYRGLVDYLLTTDLDNESLIGILFKAAMELVVTQDYERDEVLSVVAAVYDMERIMHPTSDELH